ncbi:MAG: kinase [Thermomicrobiales bacterium]
MDSQVGSIESRLIVLRGNSASGKSAAAQGIRDRFGRGIAIVGQDNLRRIVLREHDRPGAANIGLIDLTARYALDHGYHVIVEGIFNRDHYGEMLHGLVNDHLGVTRCFYFDVSFEETLRRHISKPQAVEYGETEMRQWFRPKDVLEGVDERVIPEEASLEDVVTLIMSEAGLLM